MGSQIASLWGQRLRLSALLTGSAILYIRLGVDAFLSAQGHAVGSMRPKWTTLVARTASFAASDVQSPPGLENPAAHHFAQIELPWAATAIMYSDKIAILTASRGVSRSSLVRIYPISLNQEFGVKSSKAVRLNRTLFWLQGLL